MRVRPATKDYIKRGGDDNHRRRNAGQKQRADIKLQWFIEEKNNFRTEEGKIKMIKSYWKLERKTIIKKGNEYNGLFHAPKIEIRKSVNLIICI